jgi:NAD(P)-dependent dehydrogenase (short-subunit alcohol dehydrogenase family)
VEQQSEFAGKVALVTGAAGGLGEALVRVLARHGATVLAADVKERAAQELAQSVQESGGCALGLRLDVSDAAEASGAFANAVKRYGRLDFLVNNAGIDATCAADELSLDDWDRILAVNLRGPFIMSRLAIGQMAAQGGGHIVNIASTASKRAWPNASAYHASKWGLLGLSHALHSELRGRGIKVTAVVAGGMRTPFLFDRFPDIDPETLQDPANVAETVRFVLGQPPQTVIPEVMVLPMRESSWP